MLSPAAFARIDRELAKYPADQKQSAVMAALAIAQQEKGHLDTEVMDAVAIHLGMPAVAVYEVATFYTMYNLKPVGKFKIGLCTNLPCALSGANDAAAHLKKRLAVDWNETSADGLCTLKESECLGACGDAPVMLVNDRRMASFMTPERIDALLDQMRKGELPASGAELTLSLDAR